jgi:hypothetical protein
MDQLWTQHAPAGRRPSLAPAGGGACHQWRGCRNAEGHGEPACEGVADYKTAPPSSSECDPRTMRIIALLLAVVAAVLCGCVGCEAPAEPQPPWTLEHELSLLSTQTARLLSVPCSSYAHTFRRGRYSATELLAAVRVARIQACSQGTLFAECGSPAEALDDASDWDNLVGRLQARGVSTVVRAQPAVVLVLIPPGRCLLLLPGCAARAVPTRRCPGLRRRQHGPCSGCEAGKHRGAHAHKELPLTLSQRRAVV